MSKAKAQSTAVAKPKFTLPANLEQELEQDALAIAKNVGAAAGGSRIRPQKDKTFLMPDGTRAPSPMPAVIVNFAHGNFWYDREFSPDNPGPPACFALAVRPTDLKASDNSPVKQADECKDCDLNQFKSDPRGGRGKACQNTVLIALMKPDNEDPDEPLAVMRVSSTALKYFNGYVNALTQMKMPVYAVQTDISIELLPGTGAQSLRFSNPKPLPRPVLAISRGLRDDALRMLLTEPDVSGYQAPPPVRAPRTAPKTATRR